jgi:signal transduction histidine kinase
MPRPSPLDIRPATPNNNLLRKHDPGYLMRPLVLQYSNIDRPRLRYRAWRWLRRWVVPAILVCAAGILTVPWAAYVIYAAHERAVNEKVTLLAQRVRVQMALSYSAPSIFPWRSTMPLPSPNTTTQNILESLGAELLGDPTVQAVVYLDEPRGMGGFVQNRPDVPIPKSVEEAQRLQFADPNSYRRAIGLDGERGQRQVIYVDLSRAELDRHFRAAYWPLLKHVAALTATGFILISSVCLFAYSLWGRAARQRQRSELEQQGLLAERVLTAAVLAHEIRNPLAALRFQLASLRRNAENPLRVTQTAGTIDGELSRIQQLVQDYLAHEKAQGMLVRPVALTDAVRTLKTIMEELLRSSATRLILHESVAGVVVGCDPHALRQVLMNLVLNAQQAMGTGGVITIAVGQEDQYGTIAVSDTGPGIPEELRERLFRPFNTSKKGGSGIGLALVKRFVDNFGGAVSVETEEGRGTTFRLKLPLAGSSHTGLPEEPIEAGAAPAAVT